MIIYGDKVCTNFCDLNVPEHGTEYASFTVYSFFTCL